MSRLRLAMVCCLVGCVGAAWLYRAWAPARHARLVQALLPRVEREAPFSRWSVAGAILLAGDLAWLEWREPFYFAQDDVLVGELPRALLGFRALWSGHFPAFDPYICMGAPLASLGLSSLSYPPALAAYAIARHIVGREEALFDVLACLHLLGGYLAMEKGARMLGAGRLTAPVAALSFALSGAVLMMGRSWHTMTALALWIPVLAQCVIRLARSGGGWRWALGTGGAIGIWFQVGFTQVWFYGVLLSATAVLVLVGTRAIAWVEFGWSALALLIGLAIATPLLVVQIVEAASLIPRPGEALGIGHALPALFLPWPLVSAAHPEGWGNDYSERMGTLEYFGTTFALIPLVMASLFVTLAPSRRAVAANVWLFVGLVAFLLTLGPQGGLWTLLSLVPGMRTINHHPFRLLPFFIAYVCLAGAPFLERVIATSGAPRVSGYAIGGLTTVLVLWNASVVPAHYTYGFRPYPPLPAAIAARLLSAKGANRVLPVTHLRSPVPWFGQTLALDLPDVSGIFSLDGYDPFVESSPPWALVRLSLSRDPIRTARAYGARYFVVDRSMYDPVLSKNLFGIAMELEPTWRGLETLVRREPFVRVAEDEHLLLYELPGAAPLAFRVDAPEALLPFEATTEGLRVAVPPPGGQVVLNFLARPLMVARIGGRPVPLSNDPWKRVRAEIPPDGGTLTVTYEAPWRLGLAAGAALAALSLVCGRALARADRARHVSRGGGSAPPRAS